MFNKETRPKVKIAKTTHDKIVELLTLSSIAFCFIYSAIHFSNLPEQVPMHFNYKGQVDNYGSKDSIWALAIISLVIGLVIYKLNQYPQLFNYTVPITKENAKTNYSNGQKLLRYINLGCAFLFAIITYQVITIALHPGEETSPLFEYFIYIIIGLMTFGPIIWVIKLSITKPKN